MFSNNCSLISIHAFTNITLLISSIVHTQRRHFSARFRCRLINKSCLALSGWNRSPPRPHQASPVLTAPAVPAIIALCPLDLNSQLTPSQVAPLHLLLQVFNRTGRPSGHGSVAGARKSEFMEAVGLHSALVSYGQCFCKNLLGVCKSLS